MNLYDELKRPWRAPRLVIPERSRIEAAATEIEERFGGLPTDPKLPHDYLDKAERLLIAGNGTLDRLERRHLKALPWILWSSDRRWSENRQLVTDYLNWADQEWRTSPKRLWRHYLLNLAPESFATQALARWLQARQDRLSDALRAISNQWGLFDPPAAIVKAANALIEGHDLAAEMEPLNLARRDVLASSFMLRVLSRAGRALQMASIQNLNVAADIKRLLAPLGEQPLSQSLYSQQLQSQALADLTEGLVHWAVIDGNTDETLDCVLFLVGDPRLYPARWSHINDRTRSTVEGWLTQATLSLFFHAMNVFPNNNAATVNARIQFWKGYQHVISKAWIVVAPGLKYFAEKVVGKSYGEFSSGRNIVSRHCGLMMQIGNLVIFEMNENASTAFWLASDRDMPAFFQRPPNKYDRTSIMSAVKNSTVSWRNTLWHVSGKWQTNYTQEIRNMTGL